MFANKTRILLTFPEDVLGRARVFPGLKLAEHQMRFTNACSSVAEAQQPSTVTRVGFLYFGSRQSALAHVYLEISVTKAAKKGPANANCDFWDTMTFPWPHLYNVELYLRSGPRAAGVRSGAAAYRRFRRG